MSNGTLDITVTGWVGSDVTTLPAKDGRAAYTTFRLGSTRRWWNRATDAWQDSQTEWFQVKAWRALAVNAGLSLRKGVPVVVHGRLSTREWTDQGGTVHTSLVLEATSIGVDLSYGTTGAFQRTLSGAAAIDPTEVRTEAPADATSSDAPTDVSELREAPEPPHDELVAADQVLGDDLSDREIEGVIDGELETAAPRARAGRR